MHCYKTKVRSESIEPFCKMLLHGPAVRKNSEFPFGKCLYGVEDYYQYQIAKKIQKIRAKIAKIGFAVPRRRRIHAERLI